MGRHEHHVDWRWLAFYGAASVAVLLTGSLLIYSFVEKQSLTRSLAPEPLPRITVLTSSSSSELATAWVSLLSAADFSPTLVPLENYTPEDGVLVLCDIERSSPALAQVIEKKLAAGQGVVVAGHSPQGLPPLGEIRTKDESPADALRIGEAVSPLLARIRPGHEIGHSAGGGVFAEETPQMAVDARWKRSAHAAALHFASGRGRVVWFGFDPRRLHNSRDRQLGVLLRTSMRWADGQPISDGAVGEVAAARTFVPAAREAAQSMRFSYSVDRMERDDVFGVRMTNKGKKPLENPTVRFWLPPGVRKVELAGNPIMRRKVELTAVPDESSILISLPFLQPDATRLIKVRAVRSKQPSSASAPGG